MRAALRRTLTWLPRPRCRQPPRELCSLQAPASPGRDVRRVRPSALTCEEAEIELKRLETEIAKHDAAYYNVDGTATASDAQYDALAVRETEIEALFPNLIRPGSRSRRVGAEPTAQRASRARHVAPMLSLSNCFGPQGVEAFCDRLGRLLGEDSDTLALWAEPKLDGLSLALRYESGSITRATTRGDGQLGEVVTSRALDALRDLPCRLPGGAAAESVVEVRGEVVMSRDQFVALNAERKASEQPEFANARNAAAGMLRRIYDREMAEARLDFVAYEVRVEGDDATWLPESQSMVAAMLSDEWGFTAARPSTRVQGAAGALEYFSNLEAGRGELEYEADGAVYKLECRNQQARAGYRARDPRWAIAHKFAADTAETQIEGIEVQVGRTGKLTPVALLSPTMLTGATISRASLHNFSRVEELGIAVGDTIQLRRSGDVIPQVLGVIASGGGERITGVPEECPACGSRVEVEGAAAYCTGGFVCSAQLVESVRHMATRRALDIPGLARARVAEFVADGSIHSPADVFRLKAEDLRKREGWGNKSAANLMAAIEGARNPPLGRLLAALGIRHLGGSTAEKVAAHFGGSFVKWWNCVCGAADGQEEELEELLNITSIGPRAVDAMCELARDSRRRAACEDLAKAVGSL